VRILARTFSASYLALFVAILLASSLCIALIEVMLHFDDIGARGGGPAAALEWLAVRIPSYYLRDLIPVTSFAAAFFCLALPARHGELTGLLACGVSPLRLALPVLSVAALLCGGAWWLDPTLVLRSSPEWSRLRDPGADLLLRRGPFWYHRGAAVYNVAATDPESRTLRGVEVFELGPEGRLERRIRAERVHLGDGPGWRAEDATVVRFEPDEPPRVERAEELWLDGPGAGSPSPSGRAALQTRRAEPLTVFVFALLALPLGLAVERTRSVSACAMRGGLWLGGFFGARSVVPLLILAGVPGAALAPWMLLAAFAACGVFGLARAARAPAARA
jgi:lipopolysaccharide export LptBFGC system permease protein LptF